MLGLFYSFLYLALDSPTTGRTVLIYWFVLQGIWKKKTPQRVQIFDTSIIFHFTFRMSKQGKTIIFSIHQPRYSIFRLFDNLTLLAAGRMLYHGPAQNAIEYFKSIGEFSSGALVTTVDTKRNILKMQLCFEKWLSKNGSWIMGFNG